MVDQVILPNQARHLFKINTIVQLLSSENLRFMITNKTLCIQKQKVVKSKDDFEDSQLNGMLEYLEEMTTCDWLRSNLRIVSPQKLGMHYCEGVWYELHLLTTGFSSKQLYY